MKPKILVIVILVLVVLFTFSTAVSLRRPSGKPESATPGSQSPLVQWIDTRMAQPVKAEEIRLAGDEKDAGCAWDGKGLMSVPPGRACSFTIHLGQRAWWQLNSTQILNLRLVGGGNEVDARLELEGETPQEQTLQNMAAGSVAPLPTQNPDSPNLPLPTPTPRPTPLPAQLKVYDPNNQGQDWRLTLENCETYTEAVCLVELVP